MIIVIASMSAELDFADGCEFVKEEVFGLFTFRHYIYNGKPFITCVCGSGKVFAALAAQAAILAYHPGLIINIGTSGSLGEARARDVVIGEDTIQYDFDSSPFGWRVAEVCDTGVIEYPCDDKALEIAKKYFSATNGVRFGRVMSADRVIVKKEDQDFLRSTYSGMCCEMEAAGISQTCFVYKIPYALIKSISDGDSDEENREEEFRSNLKLTAGRNAEIALKIISEY